MTPDMPQVTLTMLQRLDDFEQYILTEEGKVKEAVKQDRAPESSRVPAKVQSQDVQLKNIKGCISAMKHSIRMYRELWWKEKQAG